MVVGSKNALSECHFLFCCFTSSQATPQQTATAAAKHEQEVTVIKWNFTPWCFTPRFAQVYKNAHATLPTALFMCWVFKETMAVLHKREECRAKLSEHRFLFLLPCSLCSVHADWGLSKTQQNTLVNASHLHVPLAGPNPLLEEVLVEWVAEGAHWGVRLPPLARLRVHVVRVQTLRPGNRGHYLEWIDMDRLIISLILSHYGLCVIVFKNSSSVK